MNRRLAHLTGVLVVAALLGGCGGGERDRASARATAGTSSRGVSAPPEFPVLRVQTLDGANWDLAQQRGKWVLVNYWATWCRPCLQEMLEFSALAAMRQYIVVIGLAYDEAEPAELRAFLAQHPVTYPIAQVSVYAPPEDFGVPRTLPTSWLIGPDGRIVRKYSGQVTARMLDDDIAAHGGPKAG